MRLQCGARTAGDPPAVRDRRRSDLSRLARAALAVPRSRIDMLAGLSMEYIRKMPPRFWALAVFQAHSVASSAAPAASPRSPRAIGRPSRFRVPFLLGLQRHI